MRRINIRRIAIAFGIGVVMTIASAWTAQWISTHSTGSYAIPGGVWPTDVPADWPQRYDRGFVERSHVRRLLLFTAVTGEIDVADQDLRRDTDHVLFELQDGWPCRALTRFSGYARSGLPLQWLDLGVLRTGWRPTPPPAVRTVAIAGEFPLLPLWPGFAINTLFYGALAWGAMAGVAFVRHRRRAKPGLCSACYYPVAGLEVCPECGKAVDGAAAALPVAGEAANPRGS